MNLAYAIWGSLSGASLQIWNHGLNSLLGLFVTELRRHGGLALDPRVLKRDLALYAALMGLAGLFNTPAIVLRRLPQAAIASGPLDPIFAQDEAARSMLHMFTNLLNLWDSQDIAASLDVVLAHST